jgi:hypothetical protein
VIKNWRKLVRLLAYEEIRVIRISGLKLPKLYAEVVLKYLSF